MRPRIIDSLDHYFNVSFFHYLVPDQAYLYALMFGIVAWVFIKRCAVTKLSKYHATGMLIWAAIAGLIGTRLFYLIQNIGMVEADPGMLLRLNGATVSFGLYLGVVAGLLVYARIYKIPALNYLDVAASVIGIGIAIGRIGCFLNGDDYGKVSHAACAVRYPPGSYPFMDHVQRGWITATEKLSLPVHPVQLYGSLKGLFLFVLFTWLWRRRFFKPGILFLFFWIAYSVLRFTLEFFRGDDDRGWVGPLSTGQFMSVCIFGVCFLLLVRPFIAGKLFSGEASQGINE